MAFPSAPSVGDTYIFRGVIYTWSGSSWTYTEEGLPNQATITKTYSGPFEETYNYTQNASGYFFQNSSYFLLGGHAGNPDVIEDVEENGSTVVKFTAFEPTESGQSNVPSGLYDRSTGVITLHGFTPDMFIIVRANLDVEPDSDESQAEFVLDCVSNGATGGFNFSIDSLLLNMDQGAEITYQGLTSTPVFIGDSLSDNGGAATITPKVRLINTGGDVKPRTLAIYVFS